MAVLGACRRQGRWEVSARTSALVIFGHCHIDFREAYADAELENMKLSVFCLFGNATFLMPEGAHVRPSVVSLLASTGFDVPPSDAESSLPTIVLESTTLFGRCRVEIATDEVATDESGLEVELPEAEEPREDGEPSNARRDLEEVEAKAEEAPPIPTPVQTVPVEIAADETSEESAAEPEQGVAGREDDPVATVLFGVVERFVRCLDQLYAVVLRRRPEERGCAE